MIFSTFDYTSRFDFFCGAFSIGAIWGIFLCVLQDHHNRRVGFVGAALKTASCEDSSRPSRLHRRDTPHHLKNKRIATATVDKEKVAAIIAQVSKRFFLLL